MGFYKVIAMVGHRGEGKFGDIGLYIVAESMTDAADQAKGFPGVKHRNSSAILNAKPITEKEFVVGLLTTAYVNFDYHSKSEGIQTLSKIESSITRVPAFTTIEGKMLRNFCNRYKATDNPKLKADIDKEFVAWANSQLEDEYNNSDNFNR